MKRSLIKGLVAGFVGSLLMVGSAMALPVEWGVVNPTDITTEVATSSYTDFGYSIWTDDSARTSWHVRWADKTSETDFFQGVISMQNNSAVYSTFSFEGGDTFYTVNDNAGFFSKITTGVDGIDFTINQIVAPSYVGFDLQRNGVAMDSSKIFLGSQTVAALGQDQDFAVSAPAPVPEPATMVLFGAGLIGLIGFAKRKKK